MQSPNKNKQAYKKKYEIIQKIGAGKMGVIYKVKKIGDNSGLVYAAKHISLNDIDFSVAKKQLKILESLKHMYILHYYEQFFSQTELILITQYCGGKDLTYHINRMRENKKYFNENLVSTWIFQLIMAIDYIHSMNIIHRDLKPQNIFVDTDMNLKIGDFGVSKILQGTQHCKTMAGSPLYLSPQLIHDEAYTKKTDIWSLGCVIFQICSLEVPFRSKKGFYDLCNIIKTEQQKNLPSIYSSDLNKLVKLMLTKDPKKRPSAQQIYQHPILVNLLINYSSGVNLQQQYSQKAIQKPQLTDSFIDEKNKMINQRLKNFQEQIKMKMQGLKNKKTNKNQIQRNYQQIQKKMKQLENIMKAAFEDMKNKGQDGPIQNSNSLGQTIRNSSNLSESDETIQSVNLGGSKSKVGQSYVRKSVNSPEQQSIQSVNSIMLESKQQSRSNRFGLSSNLSQNHKTENYDNELDVTLKSQYTDTIRQSNNASDVKQLTVNRLDSISREIKNDPALILDETFLSCTLSLSNNNDAFAFSSKNAMKKKKPLEMQQSEESLNFDFSKKSYDDSLGKLKLPEKKQQQAIEDSLEEYEADFQQFEEDQDMDIRQKQKQSVRKLFTSTLKNINLKNQSNMSNASYQNPNIRSKYALSLSQIKQISSCAEGSVLSRNQSEFD